MADRIDPSLLTPLRLTTPGTLTIRPLAPAPRVDRESIRDIDARAASRLDTFQLSSHRPVPSPRTTLPTKSSPTAARMVAATVPGRIDFSSGPADPAPSTALPMYRHPADRNAAATAVNAGRVLDVEG